MLIRKLIKVINNKTNTQKFKISEIEIFNNNDQSDDLKISKILDHIKKNGFETAAVKYSMSSSASEKGDLGLVGAKSLSKGNFECAEQYSAREYKAN